MNQLDWPEQLRAIFDRGTERYRDGKREAKGFFTADENAFLASIGCTEQEMFDFVEDSFNHGEPSFESVLLVQAARRDYLYSVQNGQRSEKEQSADSFPGKTEQLEGIPWLPRIIAKARAKLRGELPPQLMYG